MEPASATLLGKIIGATLACTMMVLVPLAAVLLIVRFAGRPALLLPLATDAFWTVLGWTAVCVFAVTLAVFAI